MADNNPIPISRHIIIILLLDRVIDNSQFQVCVSHIEFAKRVAFRTGPTTILPLFEARVFSIRYLTLLITIIKCESVDSVK